MTTLHNVNNRLLSVTEASVMQSIINNYIFEKLSLELYFSLNENEINISFIPVSKTCLFLMEGKS